MNCVDNKLRGRFNGLRAENAASLTARRTGNQQTFFRD